MLYASCKPIYNELFYESRASNYLSGKVQRIYESFGNGSHSFISAEVIEKRGKRHFREKVICTIVCLTQLLLPRCLELYLLDFAAAVAACMRKRRQISPETLFSSFQLDSI